MNMNKKYISVKQYADSENITVQAVYQRIERKEIKTERVGSIILVEAPETYT
jgi:hypothetical protein